MFTYFVKYELLNVFPRSLVMKVRAWTEEGALRKAVKRLRWITYNGRFTILSVKKGGKKRG